MKYLLIPLLLILTHNCVGQVSVNQNDNRIDLNLDLYELMDTLQSLRSDLDSAASGLSTFGVSQRATSYRVIESVNTSNNTAYEIKGYTILYSQEESGNNWNYKIRVTGENLSELTDADLMARGTDLTGSYSLINPPPNWNPETWTSEIINGAPSDSSMILKIGYTQLQEALDQTDGFVDCTLVLNGFNSGLDFKFYLDANNEAPVLSGYQY